MKCHCLSPAALELTEVTEDLIFCSGRESRQSKHISLRKIRQKLLADRAVSRPAKGFYSVTSVGSVREHICLLQCHLVGAMPRCGLCERGGLAPGILESWNP